MQGKRLAGGIVVTLGLTACFHAPPPRNLTIHESCTEEEAAPYLAEGRATITGQAFTKTRGGDVKFGAGNEVWLYPGTKYWTAWYAILNEKGVFDPAPKECLKVTRKTVADGSGRFKFEHVPPGTYYLACDIFWEVPSASGLQRTGATMKAPPVVVVADEVHEVLVSQ